LPPRHPSNAIVFIQVDKFEATFQKELPLLKKAIQADYLVTEASFRFASKTVRLMARYELWGPGG